MNRFSSRHSLSEASPSTRPPPPGVHPSPRPHEAESFYLPQVTFLPFKTFYSVLSPMDYDNRHDPTHLGVSRSDPLILCGLDLSAANFFAAQENTKAQGWIPCWVLNYNAQAAQVLPTAAEPMHLDCMVPRAAVLPSHLNLEPGPAGARTMRQIRVPQRPSFKEGTQHITYDSIAARAMHTEGLPAAYIEMASTCSAGQKHGQASPSTTSSPRRQWDQAYEKTRKAKGKRGHGINLEPEQQSRFPTANVQAKYSVFVESLLLQLATIRDSIGRTEFTDEAIHQVKSRLAGYKAALSQHRSPWRVWLADPVWNLFQFFKSVSVPGGTTQAEFVELLLDLNGRTREQLSTGIQVSMLRSSSRAAKECLHNPEFVLDPDPELDPNLMHQRMPQFRSDTAHEPHPTSTRQLIGESTEYKLEAGSKWESSDSRIARYLETVDEPTRAAMRAEAAEFMLDPNVSYPRKKKQGQTEEQIRSQNIDLKKVIADLCPIDQHAFLEMAGLRSRFVGHERVSSRDSSPETSYTSITKRLADLDLSQAQIVWQDGFDTLQFYHAIREGKYTPAQIVQILLVPFPYDIPADPESQNKLVMRTTAVLIWLHYEQFIEGHEIADQIANMIWKLDLPGSGNEDADFPPAVAQLLRNLVGLKVIDVSRVIAQCCKQCREWQDSHEGTSETSLESSDAASDDDPNYSSRLGETRDDPTIKQLAQKSKQQHTSFYETSANLTSARLRRAVEAVRNLRRLTSSQENPDDEMIAVEDDSSWSNRAFDGGQMAVKLPENRSGVSIEH
ncbi:hypothetical protein HDU87_001015 [Geranomyces variabilis]|uniref:Uncharacterized protein n=1 Tax=Geranomyces variabilis TaxID=109894 RepID=A0AAD5TMT8_9FUNG|nr:hypothetical protein HDU87_001015 [Geranomyces variabilis]